MAWRTGRSIDVLREQINNLYPKRKKDSDGTIGDERHQSSNSDHNPWIKEGSMGIVTAIDFTNDPVNGIASQKLADILVTSKDERIKYIISNKKICSGTGQSHKAWEWRPYTGSNPHDKHVHISIKSDKAHYDDARLWNLTGIEQKHLEAAKPTEVIKPKAGEPKKTYVYGMYGLGGPLFSAGIEVVLAGNLRQLPNVICPPTYRFTQWKEIVDAIKKQPKGSKTVVIGHSMGAASATYVTDEVPVDLLVLYDLAGEAPSKIGKNTAKCIDIYDTVFDLVPEWRVQAVNGYESRIERWTSQYGHTGVDDSVALMKKVMELVKKL